MHDSQALLHGTIAKVQLQAKVRDERAKLPEHHAKLHDRLAKLPEKAFMHDEQAKLHDGELQIIRSPLMHLCMMVRKEGERDVNTIASLSMCSLRWCVVFLLLGKASASFPRHSGRDHELESSRETQDRSHTKLQLETKYCSATRRLWKVTVASCISA